MGKSRAAAIIAKHPWVAGLVDLRGELLVRPERAVLDVDPFPGPLLRKYLADQAEDYDRFHGADADAGDTGRSGPGTGRRRPFERVDSTIELVLRQRPRTVLEVGCGAGLRLRRLHRSGIDCAGIDFSRVAVRRAAEARRSGVAVAVAAAHELGSKTVRRTLETVTSSRPDCVLVSAASAFPSAGYFARVLRDALFAVEPGGAVVISDVPHLEPPSHRCHWFGPGSRRESGGGGPDPGARRVRLSACPEFIARTATSCDRDVVVEVHPKPAPDRQRYDVVLRAAGRDSRSLSPRVIARQTIRGGPLPHATAAAGARDRLLVAKPEPAVGPYPAGTRAVVTDPLGCYAQRLIPELLRDFLRRADPAHPPVKITITGDGGAAART